MAQTYTYDSFGNQTASSGSLTNPFQYTGRELDTETGLYYYRARYYDPVAGKFISEDPIRWVGGYNFFRYVSNEPTLVTDATGLIGSDSANEDTKCLVCAVYGEGRGLNSACQYAIASVILNRVAAQRAMRPQVPTTICDVVHQPGQFDAVTGKPRPDIPNPTANYNNCMNNNCPANDRPDLDTTWSLFSTAFPVLDGPTFFGTNTPAMRDYFENPAATKTTSISSVPKVSILR